MTEPFGPAWTSWVPHGARVVLGGIAQEDDSDLKPREADAKRILEGCAALEPRFRDTRVVERQVGLRPARDEVRVQMEQLGDARCVHNYGHGETGVGLSWGCAREVAPTDGQLIICRVRRGSLASASHEKQVSRSQLASSRCRACRPPVWRGVLDPRGRALDQALVKLPRLVFRRGRVNRH